MATLEHHLAVRLLNRTTRRISLTEEGKVFLERRRSFLNEVDEAEAAVSVGQSKPSGTLTITAPVLFQIYIAPAVARFVKSYDKDGSRASACGTVSSRGTDAG
jgi:DNA-binding transcriptional LysR family regulator